MTDLLSRLTNGEPNAPLDEKAFNAALAAYDSHGHDPACEGGLILAIQTYLAVHNTALLAEAAKRFRAIASPAEIEVRKEAARRAADAGNSAAYQYHLGCLETLVKIRAEIDAPWSEETKE